MDGSDFPFDLSEWTVVDEDVCENDACRNSVKKTPDAAAKLSKTVSLTNVAKPAVATNNPRASVKSIENSTGAASTSDVKNVSKITAPNSVNDSTNNVTKPNAPSNAGVTKPNTPTSVGVTKPNTLSSTGVKKPNTQTSLGDPSKNITKPNISASVGVTKPNKPSSACVTKSNTPSSLGDPSKNVTKPNTPRSASVTKPNTPNSAGATKPNTPNSAGITKPNTSSSIGATNPNTPSSACVTKSNTPSSTGATNPNTPCSAGATNPNTPCSAGVTKPNTPRSASVTKPNIPNSAGVTKPNTPSSAGVTKPKTPSSAGVTKPIAPSSAGVTKPNTPSSVGVTKPNTPSSVGDSLNNIAKPNTLGNEDDSSKNVTKANPSISTDATKDVIKPTTTSDANAPVRIVTKTYTPSSVNESTKNVTKPTTPSSTSTPVRIVAKPNTQSNNNDSTKNVTKPNESNNTTTPAKNIIKPKTPASTNVPVKIVAKNTMPVSSKTTDSSIKSSNLNEKKPVSNPAPTNNAVPQISKPEGNASVSEISSLFTEENKSPINTPVVVRKVTPSNSVGDVTSLSSPTSKVSTFVQSSGSVKLGDNKKVSTSAKPIPSKNQGEMEDISDTELTDSMDIAKYLGSKNETPKIAGVKREASPNKDGPSVKKAKSQNSLLSDATANSGTKLGIKQNQSITNVSMGVKTKEQTPASSNAPAKRIIHRFHRMIQTVPAETSNKLLQCLIRIPSVDAPPGPKSSFAIQTMSENVNDVFIYQKALPDTVKPGIFKIVAGFDLNNPGSRNIITESFDYGISLGHVTAADMDKSSFRENLLSKSAHYSIQFDRHDFGIVDMFFAGEEQFHAVATNIRKTVIGPRHLVVTYCKNLKEKDCPPGIQLSCVKATIIYNQNFASTGFLTHFKAPLWNKPKVEETMTIHNVPAGISLDFLKQIIPDAITIELDDKNQKFTQDNSLVHLGMNRKNGGDCFLKLFAQMYINNEYLAIAFANTPVAAIPELAEILKEKEKHQEEKKQPVKELKALSRDINEVIVVKDQDNVDIVMHVETVDNVDKLLTKKPIAWKGPCSLAKLKQVFGMKVQSKTITKTAVKKSFTQKTTTKKNNATQKVGGSTKKINLTKKKGTTPKMGTVSRTLSTLRTTHYAKNKEKGLSDVSDFSDISDTSNFGEDSGFHRRNERKNAHSASQRWPANTSGRTPTYGGRNANVRSSFANRSHADTPRSSQGKSLSVISSESRQRKDRSDRFKDESHSQYSSKQHSDRGASGSIDIRKIRTEDRERDRFGRVRNISDSYQDSDNYRHNTVDRSHNEPISRSDKMYPERHDNRRGSDVFERLDSNLNVQVHGRLDFPDSRSVRLRHRSEGRDDIKTQLNLEVDRYGNRIVSCFERNDPARKGTDNFVQDKGRHDRGAKNDERDGRGFSGRFGRKCIDEAGDRRGIDDGDSRKEMAERGDRRGIDERDNRRGIDERDNRRGIDDNRDNRRGIEERDNRRGIDDNRDNRRGIDERDNRRGIEERDNRRGIDERDNQREIGERDNRRGIDERDNRRGIDERDNRKGIDERDNRRGNDDNRDNRREIGERDNTKVNRLDLPGHKRLASQERREWQARETMENRLVNTQNSNIRQMQRGRSISPKRRRSMSPSFVRANRPSPMLTADKQKRFPQMRSRSPLQHAHGTALSSGNVGEGENVSQNKDSWVSQEQRLGNTFQQNVRKTNTRPANNYNNDVDDWSAPLISPESKREEFDTSKRVRKFEHFVERMAGAIKVPSGSNLPVKKYPYSQFGTNNCNSDEFYEKNQNVYGSEVNMAGPDYEAKEFEASNTVTESFAREESGSRYGGDYKNRGSNMSQISKNAVGPNHDRGQGELNQNYDNYNYEANVYAGNKEQFDNTPGDMNQVYDESWYYEGETPQEFSENYQESHTMNESHYQQDTSFPPPIPPPVAPPVFKPAPEHSQDKIFQHEAMPNMQTPDIRNRQNQPQHGSSQEMWNEGPQPMYQMQGPPPPPPTAMQFTGPNTPLVQNNFNCPPPPFRPMNMNPPQDMYSQPPPWMGSW